MGLGFSDVESRIEDEKFIPSCCNWKKLHLLQEENYPCDDFCGTILPL